MGDFLRDLISGIAMAAFFAAAVIWLPVLA